MNMLLESKALEPGLLSYRMYHLISKWLLLLAAVSFILIGGAAIWLGIASGLKQISFMQSAVKAVGIVTSIQGDLVNDNKKNNLKVIDSNIENIEPGGLVKGEAYNAQISIKLNNGVIENFQHRYGMFEEKPTVGQKVVVYYDPNFYTDIRAGGFVALWGHSLFILLPGLILLFSGSTMYSLLMRKTVPQNQNPRNQALILSLLEGGRRLAAIALASRECGMDIAEASLYVEELQKKYVVSKTWGRGMAESVRRLPYKNIRLKDDVRNNAA